MTPKTSKKQSWRWNRWRRRLLRSIRPKVTILAQVWTLGSTPLMIKGMFMGLHRLSRLRRATKSGRTAPTSPQTRKYRLASISSSWTPRPPRSSPPTRTLRRASSSISRARTLANARENSPKYRVQRTARGTWWTWSALTSQTSGFSKWSPKRRAAQTLCSSLPSYLRQRSQGPTSLSPRKS